MRDRQTARSPDGSLTGGQRTPRVKVAADRTSGAAPLSVRFDPAGTADPDQGDLSYAWDFDGDGTTDSTVEGPVSFTYNTAGQFQARLSVTDPTGLTGVASVLVTAGNTTPATTRRRCASCARSALVTDATRVPDADVRAVLDRDTRAVIDSIEGAATLPEVTVRR